MKEQYAKWYSPRLGRDTEMLIFGHAGYPVVLFPTSMGKYYENKDFKLIESARWFIDNGLVRLYCPDSIDRDSWYNRSVHPAIRVRNHVQYDHMIREEVVSRAQNDAQQHQVGMAGASFGAYHATNFAFRHPDLVGYLLNMGGAYDIRMHLNGYHDDNVFYNNPPEFIQGLYHPALYRMGIVLGVGEHDFCRRANEHLSETLSAKGIQHWLDIRPGADHDWPVWREMFPDYLSRIQFG